MKNEFTQSKTDNLPKEERASVESKKHRRFFRVDGKRITKTFTKKSDADRWCAEMNRERELTNAGLDLGLNPINLKDYFENWMVNRKRNG